MPDLQRVVIVGWGTWAQANNLAGAKRQFTLHGGELSNGYTIYTFDMATEFLGVDQFGSVSWKGTKPEVEEVTPRKKPAGAPFQ